MSEADTRNFRASDAKFGRGACSVGRPRAPHGCGLATWEQALYNSGVAVPDLESSNVPCIGCGYNLRGLAGDGYCPECAAAVAHSLREDRLMFADSNWLRQVHRGAWWLSLSAVGLLLPFVMSLLIPLVWLGGRGSMAGSTVIAAIMGVVAVVCVMAPLVFLVIGAWWLTIREPDPPSNDPVVARWWCRLSAAGMIVFIFLAFLASLRLGDNSAGIGILLAVAACMMGWIGCAGYLSRLFLRIPSERPARILRRRARVVLPLGVVCLAGNLLPLMWWDVFFVPDVALALTNVVNVAYAFAFIFLLVHIGRCRKPLKKALADARQLHEVPDAQV